MLEKPIVGVVYCPKRCKRKTQKDISPTSNNLNQKLLASYYSTVSAFSSTLILDAITRCIHQRSLNPKQSHRDTTPLLCHRVIFLYLYTFQSCLNNKFEFSDTWPHCLFMLFTEESRCPHVSFALYRLCLPVTAQRRVLLYKLPS